MLHMPWSVTAKQLQALHKALPSLTCLGIGRLRPAPEEGLTRLQTLTCIHTLMGPLEGDDEDGKNHIWRADRHTLDLSTTELRQFKHLTTLHNCRIWLGRDANLDAEELALGAAQVQRFATCASSWCLCIGLNAQTTPILQQQLPPGLGRSLHHLRLNADWTVEAPVANNALADAFANPCSCSIGPAKRVLS